MAINQFKDFDKTRGYSEGQQLPRGGYVCQIIGAKVENNDYGQTVKIAYDIAEGEFKDYFKRQFDSNPNEDKHWPGIYLLNVPTDDGSQQDGWTKRRFRTFTDALEDSNSGYHFDWDEAKFAGKLVGFVFNYREWTDRDGNSHMSPNPARATTVQAIREGKYKVPDDKVKASPSTTYKPEDNNGFVPAGNNASIPF
ncbi:MAG: hypothetical protein IJK56_11185 [Firmicutes bacterium]|nr:hypothetical protein [Bacillota bacterium]